MSLYCIVNVLHVSNVSHLTRINTTGRYSGADCIPAIIKGRIVVASTLFRRKYFNKNFTQHTDSGIEFILCQTETKHMASFWMLTYREWEKNYEGKDWFRMKHWYEPWVGRQIGRKSRASFRNTSKAKSALTSDWTRSEYFGWMWTVLIWNIWRRLFGKHQLVVLKWTL